MSLPNRHPPDMRAILVQGDSVRMTWGVDEAATEQQRRPLRRDAPPHDVSAPSDDELRIRLSEELDYVRRTLDALGDLLSSDPILIRRHAVALQSLDIVGQVLGHVGAVVRSVDPHSTVADIGMGDLKARLQRRNAL